MSNRIELESATYRWKLEKTKTKTAISPETEYTSTSYYDWVNAYEVNNPTVNITLDEMQALYADGAIATVVYNGATYETHAHYLDGVMDTVFGFGNPKYSDLWSEKGDVEDSGEPFALCVDSGGHWYLFFEDSTETCTFAAYIDGEGDPILVSVGVNDNAITTLEGGIVNGVFDNARYKLATPFNLLHNKPWVLEWRMSGDVTIDAGMAKIWDESGKQTDATSDSVLFRKTTKSITLTSYGTPSSGSGKTHIHHGVQLDKYGIDYTAEHLYRLENEVNADGTNMVYLYVDGVKIAPMTHTFSNSSDEGDTDWVVGRDFNFGYMGVPRYIMTGFIMDDIAVWEDGIPVTYDKQAFLNGLTMGLVSKGQPTFSATDDFTRGYLAGAELRNKRTLVRD